MKKIFLGMCLLNLICALSAFSQIDPNGPDTVYLVMSQSKIAPGGGNVQVQAWLYTDNTGLQNQIFGLTVPLVWNSTNPSANAKFDQTLPQNQPNSSGVFKNSALASWDNIGITLDSNNLKILGWAADFDDKFLISGYHLLYTLTFSILDTTTICLDTTHFPTAVLMLVTAEANAYIPQFNSVCFATEFGGVNTAPYFSLFPDSLKFVAGALHSVTVQAQDNEADPLSLFMQITPTPPGSTPVFVDSGNGKGTLEWAPALSDTGTYQVKWTAKDWSYAVDAFTFVKVRPAPTDLIPADVNCDKKVNLTDIVLMVNHVFKGGQLPDCLKAQ